MSPEIYNKARRILFSTANDPHKGFSVAYDWMEKTYRKKLDPKGYIGLMAELKFYEKHKKEYKLTIAGDMGEHADFSGALGSDVSRFDVTTNLSYKNFDDYEPFLSDGPTYRIALIDPSNFEVSDIIPLSFKRCECGGYKIPFILLMGENYNAHGESQWSNDQMCMNVCSNCSEFEETGRHTHHFLYSPEEIANGLPEDMELVERRAKINDYCLDAYKYFRRDFYNELMGVAEHSYKVTGRKGDGFWTFNFHFKNHVVSSNLPDDIDCGLL